MSFGGYDLIGSLAKYPVCTGLPDHRYLALLHKYHHGTFFQ